MISNLGKSFLKNKTSIGSFWVNSFQISSIRFLRYYICTLTDTSGELCTELDAHTDRFPVGVLSMPMEVDGNFDEELGKLLLHVFV